MASTSILLNGFSILNMSRANTSQRGSGEFKIHDGIASFEDDDIIVLLAEDTNPDGSLTVDSYFTGMIVYDNAYDYYNDLPKYTYSYSGNDDGAGLYRGNYGQGDTYLNFDAESLVSTDAGAPVLGELAIVSGMNLAALVADGVNPIRINTVTDVDADGDGIIDGNETGDGFFSGGVVMICFARGTLIETPQGPRFIETLRVGDLVNTLDNGAQPIRWIGSRKVPGQAHLAPVHIRAGMLGNLRDLVVSQNHRMLLRGAQADLMFGQNEVLAAAKDLCDGRDIRIIPCAEVEYFHFLFDAHEIVFAECCPAESLFLGEQALRSFDEDTRDEIIGLMPDLAPTQRMQATSRLSLRSFEARALRDVA